jgi:hypothetical protein
LLWLVLVFCLSAAPADCQEVRPTLALDLSPLACVVEGQAIARDCLADHPQWALAGWRCEPPSQRRERA